MCRRPTDGSLLASADDRQNIIGPDDTYNVNYIYRYVCLIVWQCTCKCIYAYVCICNMCILIYILIIIQQ